MFRTLAVLALFAVLVFTASPAQAEDNGFVQFWKKVFKYPVKTSENVAHTAGHAVSNTGGVAESAVRNTGATLSGDLDKAGQIVAEPTARTVNMSGQLVSETAGAPVKAAEEVGQEQ